MTYFFNTTTEGERIGEKVYFEAKFAIAAAKRAAKARAKTAETLCSGIVYVMQAGDIYDRRVATVTRAEVSLAA